MTIEIKMSRGVQNVEVMGTPRTTKKVNCRGCGKEIFFAKTSKGKWLPVSQLGDGTFVAHFFDCPKAKTFRRPRQDSINENQP